MLEGQALGFFGRVAEGEEGFEGFEVEVAGLGVGTFSLLVERGPEVGVGEVAGNGFVWFGDVGGADVEGAGGIRRGPAGEGVGEVEGKDAGGAVGMLAGGDLQGEVVDGVDVEAGVFAAEGLAATGTKW